MDETGKDTSRGPDTAAAAFVAPNSSVTGDVRLGEDSSIWQGATARGDMAPIRVGARTNVQDGAVLHVTDEFPCMIGDDVTVGHGAIVHACKVGNRCLVGMGSIILDGAEIGDESVVGAGALVTGGKKFPPRSLIVGSPARAIRNLLDADVEKILSSAATYVALAKKAAEH